MDDYTKDYLSTYTTGIRAVKYNKELQFFSERRNMVIDALEKFQSSCPKLKKYVIETMVKFTEKFVIWNEKQQCLQIWDWKTNTELHMNSKFNNKMKYCLSDLDECEFNVYSLQLNIYKKIIEKNTDLKFGSSHIVWFNENNPNYVLINCADYGDHVDNMFKYKMNYPEIFS